MTSNDVKLKFFRILGGYTVWATWGDGGRSGFMLGHVYPMKQWWKAVIDDGRGPNTKNGQMTFHHPTRKNAAEYLLATLLPAKEGA